MAVYPRSPHTWQGGGWSGKGEVAGAYVLTCGIEVSGLPCGTHSSVSISINTESPRSSFSLTLVALLTSRACVVCLEVCVPLRASLAMTLIALLNTERAHGAQAADLVGSFQERFHTEDKCRTEGLHELKDLRSVLWIPIHKHR